MNTHIGRLHSHMHHMCKAIYTQIYIYIYIYKNTGRRTEKFTHIKHNHIEHREIYMYKYTYGYINTHIGMLH